MTWDDVAGFYGKIITQYRIIPKNISPLTMKEKNYKPYSNPVVMMVYP